MSDQDWWCANCQRGLPGSRVTFEERCDTCGASVSQIEDGEHPSEVLAERDALRAQLAEATIRAEKAAAGADPVDELDVEPQEGSAACNHGADDVCDFCVGPAEMPKLNVSEQVLFTFREGITLLDNVRSLIVRDGLKPERLEEMSAGLIKLTEVHKMLRLSGDLEAELREVAGVWSARAYALGYDPRAEPGPRRAVASERAVNLHGQYLRLSCSKCKGTVCEMTNLAPLPLAVFNRWTAALELHECEEPEVK